MATRTERLSKTGKQLAKTTGKIAGRVFQAVGGTAADVKNGVDKAIAHRRRRQRMAKAGEVLKTVGKAAVVATAVAAAVAASREARARKRS